MLTLMKAEVLAHVVFMVQTDNALLCKVAVGDSLSLGSFLMAE